MIHARHVAVVALLAVVPAWAQPMPSSTTQAFVRAAAQSDDFERQEGRLAAIRGSTAHVRAFGRMMVADHARTTLVLKAALRRARLQIPLPPQLSPNEASKLATLRRLHGKQFDAAYIDQQIIAHQGALNLLQAYAAGGDNPVLRKTAGDTVPLIQRHLAAAQQIRGGG
ncbi:MAG TPA: DUF4142 domain-containing protein [Caulobacteraceae bacterium]|jgi:putative membrane protein